MVVIRPTRKLRATLPLTESAGVSDTALGDWYVNRRVVDRQPLLILVSSASLLSMLVRARNVRALPGRIAGRVTRRLARMGVAAPLIDAERRAMAPVRVAAAIDRSVLGIMADFARAVPYYLEAGGWDDAALELVEDRLAETPCHAGKADTVFPYKRAPELLAARWTGSALAR